MKTLLSAATLSLMTGIAIAQTATPPAATTQSPESPGAAAPAPATPDATTGTKKRDATGNVNWYQRVNDDWPASELIGTTVRNTAGENVGEVNEIILASDGKVRAVVLGVGGFLGMGERDVAIAFNALKITRDSDNDEVITVDVSKDTLTSAPQWERRRTGG
jgi:sporulation protein YlmC with PRC-barrel domain